MRRVAFAMLLPAALAACGGRERSNAGVEVPAATDEAVPQGSLPAPEAAPGSSVTGMPTAPPAAQALDTVPDAAPDAVAAAAPATAGPDAPAPAADPAATASTPVDAASPTPAAPPPSATTAAAAAPVDTAGAGSVMTQYMAALSAGAPAKAQGLWSTTPNDSAVLQLSRGVSFSVSIGAPLVDATGRVAVPVDLRGKADDGGDRHLQATYMLQRASNGGAWRIQSAAVRDVAP